MSKYIEKIKAVEEEIAGEIVDERIEAFEGRRRDEAFEFRGSLRTINAAARTFSSAYIMGLIEVEEKGYWRAWGYASFAQFIDSDEVPQFGHTKFYDLKKALLSEGPERFDLLNGKKIPLKIRKQLAANNAVLEIDEEKNLVRLGDFEAPATDRKAIIAISEAYSGAFQVLRDENTKLTKAKETLESRLERGEAENEELRRNLDGMNETSRIQRAYLHAVNSLLLLEEAVGELDPAEKQERSSDVDQIAVLFYKLTDAYGVKRSLSDTAPAGDSVDDRILRKMADEGDFEDLDDLD